MRYKIGKIGLISEDQNGGIMETDVKYEPIVVMEEEKTHRKLAIVDIDQVGNDPELLEDLIDIILAKASKQEDLISWEDAKSELKSKGLIDESL